MDTSLQTKPDSGLKISIVTCSYQQGRYLDATMRSVLEQQNADVEYIVMDGGSTDNSVDVIQRYEGRLAYWVSTKDKGQTDALIKGFNIATGDIMGWLCSDDLLLPGALEMVSRYFEEHPEVDAVYGDSLWIDGDGNFIRPKKEMGFRRLAFLFDHNYISQPSMFWRRSLYEKVGGLDARFNLAMDADLWERFSQHTKIAHIPAYLSCMRYYPEQKTRAMHGRSLEEYDEIRSRASIPMRALWPVLRIVGRAERVLCKLATGGYSARVPEKLIAALQRYRIREGAV
ncbi:MAG TPA: glycosyltransferase family 2 protein [Methylophilaceae bacterium]|nr:glycosyltransferase family 2 protein [Methylophilaceae bacterium]